MDKKIDYAEIMGVQIRGLKNINEEGEPSFGGEIYMDGASIGTFEEDSDGGPMGLYVESSMMEELKSRMDSYFAQEGFEIQDDEDYELFFIRLIEMEQLFQLFKSKKEEGTELIVVDYSDEEMTVFEVENEDGLNQLLDERPMTDYDVYKDESDFIVE